MNSRRLNWLRCIRSPSSQGRIAGYRFGRDQSAGILEFLQPASRFNVRVGSFATEAVKALPRARPLCSDSGPLILRVNDYTP
jgi:hypothetical protein